MRKSKPGSHYPDNWPTIAQKAKEETGWKCERCGQANEPGHILTVHHLDMDPSNCAWWNLAVLCQQCHLHIQAKVIMERFWMLEHSEWFKPHVAGYYAHLMDWFEDRLYVEYNADRIIQTYKDNILDLRQSTVSEIHE